MKMDSVSCSLIDMKQVKEYFQDLLAWESESFESGEKQTGWCALAVFLFTCTAWQSGKMGHFVHIQFSWRSSLSIGAEFQTD